MISFFHTYSYLLGSLYFSAAWILLFFVSTSDIKKAMLIMSPLGSLADIANVNVYEHDWWHPLILFGVHGPWGVFGIEDLLFGAAFFGIATAIGMYVAGIKNGQSIRPFWSSFFIVLVIFFILALSFKFFFSVLHLHSFYATFAACSIGAMVFVTSRPSLSRPMFLSGFYIAVLAIPAYFFTLSFNPNAIQEQYALLSGNFSGIFLFGIPVEEFLWYFVVGAVVSVIWEWARGIHFIKA